MHPEDSQSDAAFDEAFVGFVGSFLAMEDKNSKPKKRYQKLFEETLKKLPANLQQRIQQFRENNLESYENLFIISPFVKFHMGFVGKIFKGEAYAADHTGVRPHRNAGYLEGRMEITRTAMRLYREMDMIMALDLSPAERLQLLGLMINASIYAASTLHAKEENVLEPFILTVDPMLRSLPKDAINDPQKVISAMIEQLTHDSERLDKMKRDEVRSR